jgi:hypothetical protein
MSDTPNSATATPLALDPFNTAAARPTSEDWLRNPAWIGKFSFKFLHSQLTRINSDGSADPHQFYHSHDEINAALLAAGVDPSDVDRRRRTLSTPKTKMDYIVIEGISRCDLIKAGLGVHELASVFSPGVNSGPDFKIWWTGSR